MQYKHIIAILASVAVSGVVADPALQVREDQAANTPQQAQADNADHPSDLSDFNNPQCPVPGSDINFPACPKYHPIFPVPFDNPCVNNPYLPVCEKKPPPNCIINPYLPGCPNPRPHIPPPAASCPFHLSCYNCPYGYPDFNSFLQQSTCPFPGVCGGACVCTYN